jgi:hypothetical protein
MGFMYMGGGQSRRRSLPRAPIISIPNFPYPKHIFSYLMSQSSSYKIQLKTPTGPVNVTMPQPAQTSPITSTAAPTTMPAVTTRPAFSTTTAPTNEVETSSSVHSVNPVIPPGIPAFWVAAIWAMSYVMNFGPIDDYTKLKTFYRDVSAKTKEILADGSSGEKNVSALIYYCTVVSILLEPFVTTNFTYNYLNAKFPRIFNDTVEGDVTITGAEIYRKVVMVHYYAAHSSDILKPNKKIPGNMYIPITEQKVMKHAVPHILSSITNLLDDVRDDS